MPFCPKCKSEYVEGVGMCSDCDTALVKELPPEAPDVSPDLVIVYTTGSVKEAEFVKDMLNSSGVRALADPPATRTNDFYNIAGQTYNVIVLRQQVEKAVQLIRQFRG